MESLLVNDLLRFPGILPDTYGLFNFDSLHKRHLGISKMLKKPVASYISSDRNVINLGRNYKKLTSLIKLRKGGLGRRNSFLAAVEKVGRALDCGWPRLLVIGGLSGQNIFYREFRKFLERKGNRLFGMVFLLVEDSSTL